MLFSWILLFSYHFLPFYTPSLGKPFQYPWLMYHPDDDYYQITIFSLGLSLFTFRTSCYLDISMWICQQKSQEQHIPNYLTWQNLTFSYLKKASPSTDLPTNMRIVVISSSLFYCLYSFLSSVQYFLSLLLLFCLYWSFPKFKPTFL